MSYTKVHVLSDLCLQVFENAQLTPREIQVTPEGVTAFFGQLPDNFSYCSDMQENYDPPISLNEGTFSTSLDYYPGFLSRSYSVSSKIVDGLYISIYDWSYCNNVAHTVIGRYSTMNHSSSSRIQSHQNNLPRRP